MKTLGQDEDDHGVQRMKAEILQSIERWFANVEEEEVLAIAMATIMDPCFKEKFFSSAAIHEDVAGWMYES